MAMIGDLPPELLSLILECVLSRTEAASQFSVRGPWLEPGVRSARRDPHFSRNSQCLLVERSFYIAGIRALWSHLSIATYDDLQSVSKVASGGSAVGSWAKEATTDIATSTRCFEIHIRGPYNAKHVALLCRRMKRLEALIVANKASVPGIGPVPAFVIDAIVKHSKNLQNLQFQNMSEAPTLSQLATISAQLQRLNTLHVTWVLCRTCTSPNRDQYSFSFPRLTSLSLGTMTMTESDFTEESHFFLDDFLRNIDTTTIPRLNDLTILARMDHLPQFVDSCGDQLNRLTTRTGNPAAVTPIIEPCTRLKHVVFILDKASVPVPRNHGTLESIDLVFPQIRWGQGRADAIRTAMEHFFDSLEQGLYRQEYPSLARVRLLQGVGASRRDLPGDGWFRLWRRRLFKEGVHLHV